MISLFGEVEGSSRSVEDSLPSVGGTIVFLLYSRKAVFNVPYKPSTT